tara:strand:+ start:285 stop:1013 length:729 start_codon:yes stop_codon:yes gene_type:complete
MNYTFKGNFGTLELVVDDNCTASGTYQEGGTLSGTYKDGEFEGEWENKGMEGLLKFTVSEGTLTGRWKKGKDSGAMRGNWSGEQIGSQTPEKEKKVEFDPRDEGWSEAECLAVLIRHMMLADGILDSLEMKHMDEAINYYNSVNIPVGEVWDDIDDEMQSFERLRLTTRVVMGCTYYLAETLNEEQKLKLFNILIKMVTNDKELAYMEYVSLELITSVICPSMDFDNVEQTLTEYGVTILKE